MMKKRRGTARVPTASTTTIRLGASDPFVRRAAKTPGSGRRGSLNKKTLERRALMAAVRQAKARSPSSHSCCVMGKTPFDLRFAAAQADAVMHPKLSSIESRPVYRTHEDRWKPLESCSAMIEARDQRR
jgi:hypothetical protein